jgi:hypothetical protein
MLAMLKAFVRSAFFKELVRVVAAALAGYAASGCAYLPEASDAVDAVDAVDRADCVNEAVKPYLGEKIDTAEEAMALAVALDACRKAGE